MSNTFVIGERVFTKNDKKNYKITEINGNKVKLVSESTNTVIEKDISQIGKLIFS